MEWILIGLFVAFCFLVGTRVRLRRKYRNEALRIVDEAIQSSVSRSSVDPVDPVDPSPEEQQLTEAPTEMMDGSPMSVEAGKLSLVIERGVIEVRHDEAAERITWSTNFHDHFTAEDGVIRQTGHKTYGMRRLPADRLVVLVPAGFRGDLIISESHGSDITVDQWTGGNITIATLGGGTLSLGAVTEAKSLSIDSRSDMRISLGTVNAQSARIDLKDCGNVTVGNVELEGRFAAALSASGNLTCGTIKAHTFGSSQTADGKFQSGDITTAEGLAMQIDNDGGATMGDVHGGSVQIKSTDDAPLKIGNLTSATTVVLELGNGRSNNMYASGTVDSITAGTSVSILAGSDRALNIAGGVTVNEGGNFSLRSMLAGTTKVGDVVANNVTLAVTGAGNVTLGNVTASGNFASEQNDNGNVVLGNVTVAGSFSSTQSQDGHFTCGDINAKSVSMKSSDDGNITTRAIASDSSVVVTSGDGYRQNMYATVSMASIEAGTKVELTNGGDRAFTVVERILVKDGGDFTLKSTMAGATSTGDVYAHNVTVTVGGTGNVKLGNIKASGTFTSQQSDTGNFTCGNIEAAGNLTSQQSNDGNFSCGDVDAFALSMKSTDDGTITAKAAVASGSVRLETGDGYRDNMYAVFNFASLKAGKNVDVILGSDRSSKIAGDITIGEGGNFTLKSTKDGNFDAGALVANDIQIELAARGYATMRDVTASGKFTSKQTGDGNLTLGNLAIRGALDASLSDDGYFKSGNIEAQSVKIVSTDDGNVTTGTVSSASSVVIVTGDSRREYMNTQVTMNSVEAGTMVDLTVGGDQPFNIRNGVTVKDGGGFKLKTTMKGATTVGGVTAGTVSVDSTGDGSISLGNITCAGKVVTKQTDDGNITIGGLTCQRFDGELTDYGDLNIGETTAEEKFFAITKSRGNIRVRNCTTRELSVESTGDGNINVEAGSADRVFACGANGRVSLAQSLRPRRN